MTPCSAKTMMEWSSSKTSKCSQCVNIILFRSLARYSSWRRLELFVSILEVANFGLEIPHLGNLRATLKF